MVKDHRSTHKFIPIGGCKSGNIKWADSKLGYYSILFSNYYIYPATATDKKYRYKYALSLIVPFINYNPIALHFEHGRNDSSVIGNTETLYLMFGKIVLGKALISMWYQQGRLKLSFTYEKKMDYRRYKAANGIKHDYHHYNHVNGEYDYEYEKDNQREINKGRKTL